MQEVRTQYLLVRVNIGVGTGVRACAIVSIARIRVGVQVCIVRLDGAVMGSGERSKPCGEPSGSGRVILRVSIHSKKGGLGG